MEKVITIKEIAKRLNISPSSVSRALSNHKSIGLKTKTDVQRLAKELNYEPNQTAIFFQQRKTFTIGVILPSLSEEFFSSAISGIEDLANENKYTVLMGQSHDDVEREKQLVDTMKNHRVDGLIISISKNTEDYSHFEAIKKFGIPVVFFDRVPDLKDIHYVWCNIISGTTQAYNFLRELGHQSIGMINGPTNLLASKERVEGYKNALIQSNLNFDPSLIVSCNLSTKDVFKATEELLNNTNKPTAIIAFNDYVLLDAAKAAAKMKLKINKDISFVSFAHLPICHYAAHPPLASVDQFSYKQGKSAMEIMLQLLAKDRNENNESYIKIIIEPKLIVLDNTID